MEPPTDASFFDPPLSAAPDVTCPVDQTVGRPFWDFSFSESSSLVLFLVFLSSALLSLTINGLLFFLTVRYKQRLWQPQYMLIKNITACGFGLTGWSALIVSSSLVQRRMQVLGGWCIVQFCTLRFLFLTSQMTLALMAVERYVFICHSIHYHRVINTTCARASLAVIWLTSGVLSVQGGLVLNGMMSGRHQQTNGLLCSAISIKELIAFSFYENLSVFGGPSIIGIACVLSFCYCYGCMYRAALQVNKALKLSNLRANYTVGLYMLMFLLQMVPNSFFVVLTFVGKAKSTPLRTVAPLLTPVLIVIPTAIQATFFLTRNRQIRELLVGVKMVDVLFGKGPAQLCRGDCNSSSFSPRPLAPASFDPLSDPDPAETCVSEPLGVVV